MSTILQSSMLLYIFLYCASKRRIPHSSITFANIITSFCVILLIVFWWRKIVSFIERSVISLQYYEALILLFASV